MFSESTKRNSERSTSQPQTNALDLTFIDDYAYAQHGPVIQKGRLARSAGVTDLKRSAEENTVRWEDQELNHASPEGKYPEVLAAKFSLLAEAEQSGGRYVRVDQLLLDALPLRALREKKESPRIDRVCLHFRLSCGLGAGGERYPVLGVMHYRADSKSRYAIVHVSPGNDWLRVMSVAAEEPISEGSAAPERAAGPRLNKPVPSKD